MLDQEIVNSVQKYLNRLAQKGIPVSFGVVFGSYATGSATPLSDIDLIVVSPEFDKQIQRKSIDQLWHLAARTDSRIEPIPCGHQQWQNDTSNAVIEIARNQGTTIYSTP